MAIGSILRRAAVLAAFVPVSTQALGDSHVTATMLLKTDKTVLGQQLGYRTDAPLEIAASLVVLAPGAETGEHLHPAPTLGYILEGELTVHCPEGVTRVYGPGEAVMEAVNVWHRGINNGAMPVRILVVNLGVKGLPGTIER